MKVLSFIAQRSYARFVAFDLAEAARSIGWTVLWSDVEALLTQHAGATGETGRREVARLLAELTAFDPHLVFSYGLEYLDRVFEPLIPGFGARFSECLPRPAVYFFFDLGAPFDGPLEPLHSPVLQALQGPDSLVLCWDRDGVDLLRGSGVTSTAYFPMAVNPAVFYPEDTGDGDRPDAAIFVGGPSEERLTLLEGVAHLGLAVYGYDAEDWRRSATLARCYRGELARRDDVRRAYSRTRIAINVTRPHGPTSLNMRAYEAMACGCLLLTDDKSDAARLFEPDRHLVVYTSAGDLRTQLERYLRDDSARREIAARGREEVLAAHTYPRRLERVRPLLEQFRKESRLLERLAGYTRSDPDQARAFADWLAVQGLISLHCDTLDVRRAGLLAGAGEMDRARELVARVLADTPAHVEARRLLIAEPMLF